MGGVRWTETEYQEASQRIAERIAAGLGLKIVEPPPLPKHRPRYKSKAEAEWALRLEARRQRGEVVRFEYEAVALRLGHDTRYHPDFLVILPGGVVQFEEVKGGYIRPLGRAKLMIAAKQFPEFRFVLCQKMAGEWTETEIGR
jgi:hypothetical protein